MSESVKNLINAISVGSAINTDLQNRSDLLRCDCH